MKLSKILIAALMAASATSQIQAQTVVHITGSTAFRNATLSGIGHILQPGYTWAYAGTSASGANQSIYTGTTTNGIPVIIKTSWSGAVGGMQTVSQQYPISTWLTNTTPQSTAGTPSAPAVYDPPAIPEVGMDDGIQANTFFPTPVLVAQNVGVVTFKFVASKGAPAGLTNMTPLAAQALWANGNLPLAFLTGNHADETSQLFAIGRDADSGTRKCTFSETGIGPFSTVVQYFPVNAGGAPISRTAPGPITGQELVPAETVDSIFFNVGNGGYSSGGDLAVAMEQTTSAIGGYYVTYLGLADSTTAINGGAVELAWNGIRYSDTSIEEGQYTFWGFEQLCYRQNYGTVDPNGKKVADTLATQIINVDAALAGELLSTMHVSRAVEGGLVGPTY